MRASEIGGEATNTDAFKADVAVSFLRIHKMRDLIHFHYEFHVSYIEMHTILTS